MKSGPQEESHQARQDIPRYEKPPPPETFHRDGASIPEESLDQAASLAASLFDAKAVLVAVTCGERRWFRLSSGSDGGSREGDAHSKEVEEIDAGLAVFFSAQTARAGTLAVIEDVTDENVTKEEGARVSLLGKESSLTKEPGFRFYAGAPLLSPEGEAFGALSVLGAEAHSPPEEKMRRLEDLASMASRELMLRRELEELQETEWALLKREKSLRSIVDHVSDGIYRSAPEEGLIYANQAFADMFGYESQEEVLALDPADLYPDADERKRLMRLEDKQGQLGGIEVRFRRKDGTVFLGRLHSRAIYDEEGEVTYYDGHVTDITEQKKREQALRQSQRRFEAVFEDPEMLVGVLSPDGTLLKVNQTALQYLGESQFLGEAPSEKALEVIGKPFWETPWWSEEVKPKVRGWVARAAGGEYVEYETEHPSPEGYTGAEGDPGPEMYHGSEGRNRRVRGTIRPVTAEDGEVRSLVVSARDVTEQKKKERQLEKAKEEAEEANRLKSALLANLSHDIRTPLTSIIGFAEAIGDLMPGKDSSKEARFGGESPKEESPGEKPLEGTSSEKSSPAGDPSEGDLSPEERSLNGTSQEKPQALFSKEQADNIHRFAELIEKSGRRLLETLNSVLDFSKLEAGSIDLELEPVNLARQVEEAADLFERRTQEKEIRLEVKVTSTPLQARADRGALHRVLQNLLSNAIKFTGGGGRVDLRAWKEQDAACLEVEDTGKGIDPDFLPHLFDAFRQEPEGENYSDEGPFPNGNSSDTRSDEGSGLGLAVTKKLLNRMKGDIEVESEVGEGTCFTIRLPLAEDHPPEKEHPSGKGHPPGEDPPSAEER